MPVHCRFSAEVGTSGTGGGREEPQLQNPKGLCVTRERGQSWGHWDGQGKGGGFWLEKIPMPADICEQEEVVPEYPGNPRAWEELTGMQGRCAENQEQECCDWSPALGSTAREPQNFALKRNFDLGGCTRGAQ